MKSRNSKKKKSSTTGSRTIFIAFAILFAVVIILLPSVKTRSLSYGANIPFTPVPAKPNLQLEWFLVPTNAPPQQQVTFEPQKNAEPIVISNPSNPPASNPNPATCAGYVNSGVPLPASCECPDVYIICPFTKSDPTDVTVGPNGCLDPLFVGTPPQTGKFCIDKPVVYLYPQQPKYVTVSVQTTGSVVVSNPHYPQGGWVNVLANPGGSLLYQGSKYTELFYETSVTQFQKPTKGLILATNTLPGSLAVILGHLGLIGQEKQEFLSYWVPRLTALHSPYIYFSLLSPSAKAAIDQLKISPKPDTMIDFIAYFKPVKTASNNSVLQLPNPPQRKGFTGVEWGGVLDN